jgi:imidazolonepropionase-like amidohydrolase
MRWITSNPAKAAGILDQTGSIEVGKDADIVLWTGNPFSIYSRAETVLIDGALAFDMNNPKIQPITDFDLGIIQPQANRVQ